MDDGLRGLSFVLRALHSAAAVAQRSAALKLTSDAQDQLNALTATLNAFSKSLPSTLSQLVTHSRNAFDKSSVAGIDSCLQLLSDIREGLELLASRPSPSPFVDNALIDLKSLKTALLFKRKHLQAENAVIHVLSSIGHENKSAVKKWTNEYQLHNSEGEFAILRPSTLAAKSFCSVIEERDEVMKQNEAISRRVEDLESELTSARSELANANKQVSNLTNQNSALQRELAEVKAETSARISSLEEQLADKFSIIEDLKSQLATETQKASKLQAEMVEQTKELTDARIKMAVAEEKVRGSESQLQLAQRTVEQLEVSKNDMESRLHAKSLRVEEMEEQIHEVSERAVQSEIKTAEARGEQLAAETSVRRLEQNLAVHDRWKSEWNSVRKSVLEAVQQLEGARHAAPGERANAITGLLEQRARSTAQAQHEAERYRMRAVMAESQRNDMAGRCAELERQLSSARLRLVTMQAAPSSASVAFGAPPLSGIQLPALPAPGGIAQPTGVAQAPSKVRFSSSSGIPKPTNTKGSSKIPTVKRFV